MAKYRGRFDAGWDVAREQWFARQVELGLVPEGTELAPRNPGVDAVGRALREPAASSPRGCRRRSRRSSTTPTTRSAGSSTTLAELGELDNTLVFVLADNGASQEGGPFGVLHEMKFFNGILETPDEAIAQIDEIGGPHSHSNYPWGWAQAGNTPFKWYKQNTHEGGVHVPLDRALAERHRRPRRAPPAVPPRERHRAVDLRRRSASSRPAVYRGLEQMPVTGTSMRYTFDAPDEPSRKTVQYFEMARPPRHLRRRLEGRHPPHRRDAVRRRRVGAVPRRRGLLGVPRPRRDDARQARRADRAVVGARPRRTACSRSTTA